MDITRQDIARFQQIWREEFKEEIDEDKARECIGKLDTLYSILLKLPEEAAG
jgi:hypothetical protein